LPESAGTATGRSSILRQWRNSRSFFIVRKAYVAIVDKMNLGRELVRTLSQINNQIEEVKDQAENSEIDPYRLRDTSGNWILIPLLGAKAQCLHALAIINQRD
jgi:hypothetical protein